MSSAIDRIGLIGLGLLGAALAERLGQQSYSVCGFDVDEDRNELLRSMGGHVCLDASEVFGTCDLVIVSLPTSEFVRAIIDEQRGGLREGLTIVDTTTGEPEQMVSMSKALGDAGVNYVEATVAGSSDQLRQGLAVLFVGGAKSVVQRVQSLLQAIAEKYFYLGAVGSASRFKLVHNLLLGLHRAVLAEGLTFAEALGFDSATALDILRQTPAESAVMRTKGQKMVTGSYLPQARLSQHLKDVRLILEEAIRVEASVPLSKLHKDLLETAERLGFGDSDNSAVIEVFRSASK